jgi:hypothetical protein
MPQDQFIKSIVPSSFFPGLAQKPWIHHLAYVVESIILYSMLHLHVGDLFATVFALPPTQTETAPIRKRSEYIYIHIQRICCIITYQTCSRNSSAHINGWSPSITENLTLACFSEGVVFFWADDRRRTNSQIDWRSTCRAVPWNGHLSDLRPWKVNALRIIATGRYYLLNILVKRISFMKKVKVLVNKIHCHYF